MDRAAFGEEFVHHSFKKVNSETVYLPLTVEHFNTNL